jgi:hypothetical protein
VQRTGPSSLPPCFRHVKRWPPFLRPGWRDGRRRPRWVLSGITEGSRGLPATLLAFTPAQYPAPPDAGPRAERHDLPHAHPRRRPPARARTLGDEFGAEQAQRVRLELLKATYRLESTAHPDLYRAAGDVLRQLDLETPVTFYQATGETTMNAGLCFVPGEAHVVLAGRVLARLDPRSCARCSGTSLRTTVSGPPTAAPFSSPITSSSRWPAVLLRQRAGS